MKTKKPITQSITNRREHSSRFKAMFYVIGFEIQRRVLLHTAPANRTKSVVEQFGTFRSTESVSGRPDISQYGRTVYSVVYIAAYRCATIIQIMRYVVKGVKSSHYIQNFKRQISTNAEKVLYLLGHLMKKNQRHKNLCQCGTNYFSKNSVQLGQNFQNQLPDNLSGILNYHF